MGLMFSPKLLLLSDIFRAVCDEKVDFNWYFWACFYT